MLDEKRIKEAESNIRQYLEDHLIKKQTNITAQEMYIENCEVSLQTAQKLSELEDNYYKPFLWVIVSSYYSMYYITNAVLLKNGYKVGNKISHKVTSDALIVFIRKKLRKQLLEEYEEIKKEALELTAQRTDLLIKTLDYEREKRSRFQYQTDEKIKKGKAITSLKRAKEFIFEMKKLL